MAMSKYVSDRSVILRKHEAQEEFVNGIQSLDKAVQAICQSEISRTTSAKKVKSIAQSLRLPIAEAHRHLTRALDFWKDEKARQCDEIERLLSTINSVKNTVSQKQRKIEEMSQQRRCLDKQIHDSEQRVGQAKVALTNANDALNYAERKLSEKRKERDLTVGIGAFITPIPIVGWIAGPTMIVVGLTALEDNVKSAKVGVSSAEDNVTDCENSLEARKREKNSLCQQLRMTENEKQVTARQLREYEQQLQNLKVSQRRSIELSEKLMRTCHVMTSIWGKSQVLNKEARYAYSLEPLLLPLKEILDMFTPEEQRKIKQNTFLLSERVNMSTISWKLKAISEAITDSSLTAILDDYT